MNVVSMRFVFGLPTGDSFNSVLRDIRRILGAMETAAKEISGLQIRKSLVKVIRHETATIQTDNCTSDHPLSILSLGVRARNTLLALGVGKISELIRLTPDALLEIKGCGMTTLQEIQSELKQKCNLTLRES